MPIRMLAVVIMLLLSQQPARAAETGVDERIAAWRGFRAAFDAGRFADALPQAEEVARLTEGAYGNDALPLVTPLTNLGTTYYRLGQYGPALDAYTRALTILDERAVKTDRRLVRPLHGLGASLHALGRYEEAVAPLRRAVEIVRNQDGLYDAGQLPVLRTLVATYVELGRVEEAGQQHQYALAAAEAAYGRDDVRLLRTLDEFARFDESIGRYTSARALHARAIALVDKAAGPRSPLMIPALRGVARSYRLAYLMGEEEEQPATSLGLGALDPVSSFNRVLVTANPEGERALRFGVQLLREAKPPDPRLLGEVQTDLGDWHLVVGSTDKAREQYREAWNSLSTAGATSLLQTPQLLIYRPPPMSLARKREDAADYLQQKVTVSMTVLADGQTRDVAAASGAVPESVSKPVVTALRRARYRPRITDGRAVEATGISHTETMLVKPPKE